MALDYKHLIDSLSKGIANIVGNPKRKTMENEALQAVISQAEKLQTLTDTIVSKNFVSSSSADLKSVNDNQIDPRRVVSEEETLDEKQIYNLLNIIRRHPDSAKHYSTVLRSLTYTTFVKRKPDTGETMLHLIMERQPLDFVVKKVLECLMEDLTQTQGKDKVCEYYVAPNIQGLNVYSIARDLQYSVPIFHAMLEAQSFFMPHYPHSQRDIIMFMNNKLQEMAYRYTTVAEVEKSVEELHSLPLAPQYNSILKELDQFFSQQTNSNNKYIEVKKKPAAEASDNPVQLNSKKLRLNTSK